MYNMSGSQYNTLYTKYLKRSPKELFDYAGFKKGDIVWDLCAGSNLRATEMALGLGAKLVVAVDLNEQIMDKVGRFNSRFYPMVIPIDSFMRYGLSTVRGAHCGSREEAEDLEWSKPNVVICQQAINYWFKETTIENLSQVMLKGSTFVFNTFTHKPSVIPKVSEYNINNLNYVETVWSVEDTIHHVQIVEGLSPHVTSFRWITKAEYIRVLEKYFKLECKTDKSTDIYVCTKE